MLSGKIVKVVVLRAAGEERRCVFKSVWKRYGHIVLPFCRQDKKDISSGIVSADLEIAFACGAAVHIVETAQHRSKSCYRNGKSFF